MECCSYQPGLVFDEDWPLACVIRILRGKNDTVRAYEVRTETGIKKKPVSKLALLLKCST